MSVSLFVSLSVSVYVYIVSASPSPCPSCSPQLHSAGIPDTLCLKDFLSLFLVTWHVLCMWVHVPGGKGSSFSDVDVIAYHSSGVCPWQRGAYRKLDGKDS